MIAVPTRDSLVLGQDFRTDKMLRADRLGGEDLGEVGQMGLGRQTLYSACKGTVRSL